MVATLNPERWVMQLFTGQPRWARLAHAWRVIERGHRDKVGDQDFQCRKKYHDLPNHNADLQCRWDKADAASRYKTS